MARVNIFSYQNWKVDDEVDLKSGTGEAVRGKVVHDYNGDPRYGSYNGLSNSRNYFQVELDRTVSVETDNL